MNNLKRYILSAIILLGTMGASYAFATEPNPYLKPNNTWISISGTVNSVTMNTFELDYGNGTITVEMDDGDRDADAYKLLKGDKVTVNGMIDDDFFETTKIEAASVYVEKLGTYFYADPIDEEDYVVWYTVPVVTGQIVVQGQVTQVDGDEFVVNTGLRSVTVDVDEMPYNPLDDDGYQKIKVGDMIRATGEMEDDLFEQKELRAKSIVILAS